VKLLADESVDCQIVQRLRKNGYTVQYVAEMEPGITDEVVLGLANQDADVLVTPDKDFGELVFRRRLLASGILLGRPAYRHRERQTLLLQLSRSMLEKCRAPLPYSRSALSAFVVCTEAMAPDAEIAACGHRVQDRLML